MFKQSLLFFIALSITSFSEAAKLKGRSEMIRDAISMPDNSSNQQTVPETRHNESPAETSPPAEQAAPPAEESKDFQGIRDSRPQEKPEEHRAMRRQGRLSERKEHGMKQNNLPNEKNRQYQGSQGHKTPSDEDGPPPDVKNSPEMQRIRSLPTEEERRAAIMEMRQKRYEMMKKQGDEEQGRHEGMQGMQGNQGQERSRNYGQQEQNYGFRQQSSQGEGMRSQTSAGSSGNTAVQQRVQNLEQGIQNNIPTQESLMGNTGDQ